MKYHLALHAAAGIAARIRVIEDTSFYLEEFSSRALNFHKNPAALQPTPWSIRRHSAFHREYGTLNSKPAYGLKQSSADPSNSQIIIVSRKASTVGEESDSSEATTDSTAVQSVTVSESTHSDSAGSPDDTPFLGSIRTSETVVSSTGYGVNVGVTLRPARRPSLLCMRPSLTCGDDSMGKGAESVQPGKRSNRRYSLRRIFGFHRRGAGPTGHQTPTPDALPDRKLPASRNEKVQPPTSPSDIHRRVEQPIVFSDRRRTSTTESAPLRQSYCAIPVSSSANFNCVKHGYLVDTDVRSGRLVY